MLAEGQARNALPPLDHNSFGIILSAIIRQMIAECVTRGHVPDIIRPFSIVRFEQE
jgi:hypothetical protein